MSIPKVSVIIPTFNRPASLNRALQSVCSQSFKDFDIFIIQNGGNEYAKEIAGEFRKQAVRIHYVHEKEACAVNARNVGVRRSNGEFIAFLDDDDEWLPEKLSKQVDILNHFSEIGLVTCGGWLIDQHNNTTGRFNELGGYISLGDLITQGSIRTLSTVLIRRTCFDQVGLFDRRFLIANDYDLYTKIVQNYRSFNLGESLVRYHKHSGNLSTTNLAQMWLETAQILQNIKFKVKNRRHSKPLNDTVVKYSGWVHDLAVDAMDEKRFRFALKYYWKVLKLRPAIGISVSWGRYQNLVYRFIRPYLAILYCSLSLVSQEIHRRIENQSSL